MTDATTTAETTGEQKRPVFAHMLRILAVPIILFWVAVAVIVNVVAPQLEVVGELHSAPMAPEDAPSMRAMKLMGANFKEFNSNSTIMVVIEGQQPLGPDAHDYYNEIIRKLQQDPEHIQHIQDFWGDTLTAAGAQSADGKASYVMLNLAGEQGQTLANEGVQAVRKVIADTKAPPGVQAYVAGPAALTDDLHVIGNASLGQITLITLIAIAGMLLVVYRSIVTTLIQLFLTFIGLLTARGVISVLAVHNVFGLTTFAGNILTMLAIAAGTDYGIFIFGRYREDRGMGLDRDDSYYATFKSVSPVIVGSGLTIAGATYCLSFARLPYFSTMGAPVAIGMVVVVAIAVTLGPAVLFLGSRVGLYESKRPPQSRFWRKVGTAVVRWPAPIFVASLFVVLIGIVAIPGYKPAYNDRYYLPKDAPVNVGFAAADRHFTQARMNPDILMVEADHDMRNPADMLVLNAVARNVMHTEGIAMVQNITRPLGIPIQHSSIPFQTSIQGQTSNMNLPFQRDQLANQLKTIDATNASIDILEKQYQLSLEQTRLTQDSAAKSQALLETTEELRDNIANFDDQFRPLRNYFYWEPHCFDIPLCAATKSLFDALDGIDEVTDQTGAVQVNTDKLADLAPKLTALLPQTIATMKASRDLSLATYNSQKAVYDQQQASNDTALAMGQSFDQAKNDDLFFLPPEAFQNPDFERGLKMFLSPDGKSARMFITHEIRPRDTGGHRPRRQREEGRAGGLEDVLAVERQDLPGWGGRHLQRHGRRREVRPDDRRGVGADADLHDHAHPDPKCGGGPDHRRHGGQLDRRVIRYLGAAVAGPVRHQSALARHVDVGHHPVGGGIGLQPAAGVPVQGRDPRRTEDRHHPVDGRYRWCGHLCGSGVRRHHGSDDVQQADRAGADGVHHRHRPIGGHADRALAADAVDRNHAWAGGSGGRKSSTPAATINS